MHDRLYHPHKLYTEIAGAQASSHVEVDITPHDLAGHVLISFGGHRDFPMGIVVLVRAGVPHGVAKRPAFASCSTLMRCTCET
eukprot:2381412-Pyramimonas_sp.AAC.1